MVHFPGIFGAPSEIRCSQGTHHSLTHGRTHLTQNAYGTEGFRRRRHKKFARKIHYKLTKCNRWTFKLNIECCIEKQLDTMWQTLNIKRSCRCSKISQSHAELVLQFQGQKVTKLTMFRHKMCHNFEYNCRTITVLTETLLPIKCHKQQRCRVKWLMVKVRKTHYSDKNSWQLLS